MNVYAFRVFVYVYKRALEYDISKGDMNVKQSLQYDRIWAQLATDLAVLCWASLVCLLASEWLSPPLTQPGAFAWGSKISLLLQSSCTFCILLWIVTDLLWPNPFPHCWSHSPVTVTFTLTRCHDVIQSEYCHENVDIVMNDVIRHTFIINACKKSLTASSCNRAYHGKQGCWCFMCLWNKFMEKYEKGISVVRNCLMPRDAWSRLHWRLF